MSRKFIFKTSRSFLLMLATGRDLIAFMIDALALLATVAGDALQTLRTDLRAGCLFSIPSNCKHRLSSRALRFVAVYRVDVQARASFAGMFVLSSSHLLVADL
jgi:hypothetical protein